MAIVKLGDKFNHWTVTNGPIKEGKPGHLTTYWLCQCSCGETRRVQQYSLVYGKSKSCGCVKEIKEATRQLMSQARKQREESPWPKGKKHSPEAKAKMAAAQQARRAAEKGALHA